MTAGYAIRAARLSDADKLPDIERRGGEAFRSVPDLAWIADDEVMSADVHRSLITQGTAWVAEEGGGRLIGFLSAEAIGDDFHVWNVSVLPERQQRGIGRALFETLVEAARASGAKRLTLTTFRDLAFNERFYSGIGFVTLPIGRAGERLEAVLAEEAAHGLPAERRCAMAMPL